MNAARSGSNEGGMDIETLATKIRRRFHTTRADVEWMWSTQHERREGWVDLYQQSWSDPHRGVLLRCLEQLGPHESLLELGCNAGPNLIAISKGLSAVPARMHGIDLNAPAVEAARGYFERAGWRHISVERGLLPEAAAPIGDRSWDAVIAIAHLMHLAPGAFEQTLAHAQRIARRHLIIMDLHQFKQFQGARPVSLRRSPMERWRRDWWSCFRPHADWEIDIQEMPPDANLADIGDINALVVARRRRSRA